MNGLRNSTAGQLRKRELETAIANERWKFELRIRTLFPFLVSRFLGGCTNAPRVGRRGACVLAGRVVCVCVGGEMQSILALDDQLTNPCAAAGTKAIPLSPIREVVAM